MDYRIAALAAFAVVLVAGCLGAGPGGPGANASETTDGTMAETDVDADGATSTEAEPGSDATTPNPRPSTLSSLDQYYLYVNEDQQDRRVSLFVVDGDVDAVTADLANGTTVTAAWPAPELLRQDVAAIRPAEDVHWSETFTVESGSNVLLSMENASETATVMKVSTPNATADDDTLSNVALGIASAGQTVAVDGEGSQRSVSGASVADTEYADVSIDTRRTITLGCNRTGDR